MSAFGTFRLHLTISNLLVLWIYCPAKSVWLLMHVWHGGSLLCKLYSYVSMFSFQLWSNLVVAISLDTLLCLQWPMRFSPQGSHLLNRLMLAAWLVAALISTPQLIVRDIVRIPVLSRSLPQCFLCRSQISRLLFSAVCWENGAV